MEMHQVRYFLAVAEELNFTRAAEKCNVAQPSLTRAIKLLEHEFGGVLFHRERANTHLSELGRMVRPYLEQVHAQASAARDLARDFVRLQRTRLKLGIMCTIAPNQLVDLLGRLNTRYPGLELELLDASGPALQERLIEGEFEVAIYCVMGLPPDDRLHVLPLFREQMMIVVHPEHHLAMKNMIEVRDLDGERYLERINCEFGNYAGRFFEERGVRDETVYRSERDDWILAMVAAGLGYAFMPERCVTHPGVVARPLIEPEFWRDVNLVTVRGRPYSPGVGALVREAMRVEWMGRPAVAAAQARETIALDQ